MLLNIVRTLRPTNQTKQWAHQIQRSYAYKPVDRSFTDFRSNRTRRKINPYNYDHDYDEDGENVRRSRFFAKPKWNPPGGGLSMEIIESVPSTIEELSVRETLIYFAKLSCVRISDEALTHENFSTLIDSVKLNASSLSVWDLVELFKNICDAEVPMFDELNEFIATTLFQRYQSLTVDNIIDIDFVIRKHYGRETRLSKLFDQLRRRTRSIFLDKLDYALDKDQNCRKLMRTLKYLSNNRSLMKDMLMTMRLTELIIELNDKEFSKDDAVFIIVACARLPELTDGSNELVRKAFQICCNELKDADEAKTMLKLLVEKKVNGAHLSSLLYITFFRHCTNLAIADGNVTTAFDILNAFNEMHWTHRELIDFLSKVFNDNNETQLHQVLRPIDYVTLCTACNMTGYKPANWHTKIVPAIEKAPTGSIEYHKKIDYALTLHKLGVYHEQLIERLMKSSEIEMWYSHKPAMKELRRIYGNDDEKLANWCTYAKWLKTDLEKFVGPKKLLTNVSVSRDVAVPIAIKIDINTGDLCDMNHNTNEENLICRHNQKIVGIPGFVRNNLSGLNREETLDKQEELMTKLGWLIVRLDEYSYGKQPVFKRAFVFFRELFWAIEASKKTK